MASCDGSYLVAWEGGDDVPLTAEEGAWTTLAPSAIPFRPDWPTPREMDGTDLEISRNTIGVNVQEALEGYDFFEAVEGLLMFDNAINFDTAALRIPGTP